MSSTVEQKASGSGHIFTGSGDLHIVYDRPPGPPAEAEDRRNLLVLLEKVQRFWIEGVLENSIHGAALLDLGKEAAPGAVEHPWEKVLDLPGQAAVTLPPDRKIIDVFDKAGRSLLLLGAPGSGKTITLLELARDLGGRAETNAAEPVPVVFMLSTWTKRRPLREWLSEELRSKYQIPEEIGTSWLKKNRLLLLLDGLDEVAPSEQGACVSAINNFAETFGLGGLVVTSRLEEYTSLPVRLRLGGSIRLQPLTAEQVDAYCASGGDALAGLRDAIQADEVLQEMARSPLSLSIMSLAYWGVWREEVTAEGLGTVEARREHLFDTYVKKMLSRKGRAPNAYTWEQTRAWLSFLARNMVQRSQTVFLLEQLQPSWLSTRRQRVIYAMSSRMAAALVFAVASAGAILSTVTTGEDSIRLNLFSDYPYIFILMLTAAAAIAFGLSAGILYASRSERSIRAVTAEPSIPLSTWRAVSEIVALTLFLSWAIGIGYVPMVIAGHGTPVLSAAFVQPIRREIFLLVLFAYTVAPIGAFYGLAIGYLFGLRSSNRSVSDEIQSIESLSWSPTRALEGGPMGIWLGIVFGLITSNSKLGWLYLTMSAILATIVSLLGGLLGLSVRVLAALRARWLSSSCKAPADSTWPGIESGSRYGATAGIFLGGLFWAWAADSRHTSIGCLLNAGVGALCGSVISFLRMRGANQDRWIRESAKYIILSSLNGALLPVVAEKGGQPGLFVAFVVTLLAVIVKSVTKQTLEKKSAPNQGIRLSMRNALFGWLTGFLIGVLPISLLAGLGESLDGGPRDALLSSIGAGLLLGAFAGAWYGGLDVLQHYTLRIILALTRRMPLNCAAFLDHATRLLFLQKVGGGYIFIHRSLLEYFAAKER